MFRTAKRITHFCGNKKTTKCANFFYYTQRQYTNKIELNDTIKQHLLQLQKTYESLIAQDSLQQQTQQMKYMSKVIAARKKYDVAKEKFDQAAQFANNTNNEKELREMAKEEALELHEKVQICEKEVLNMLMTEDDDNERNIILEVCKKFKFGANE